MSDIVKHSSLMCCVLCPNIKKTAVTCNIYFLHAWKFEWTPSGSATVLTKRPSMLSSELGFFSCFSTSSRRRCCGGILLIVLTTPATKYDKCSSNRNLQLWNWETAMLWRYITHCAHNTCNINMTNAVLTETFNYGTERRWCCGGILLIVRTTPATKYDKCCSNRNLQLVTLAQKVNNSKISQNHFFAFFNAQWCFPYCIKILVQNQICKLGNLHKKQNGLTTSP